MLVTDGHLTDDEYAFFTALLDRMELTGEARSEVTGAVSLDTDISDDVKLLKASGLGDELLEELRKASEVDGDTAPIEEDVMRRVEKMLES